MVPATQVSHQGSKRPAGGPPTRLTEDSSRDDVVEWLASFIPQDICENLDRLWRSSSELVDGETLLLEYGGSIADLQRLGMRETVARRVFKRIQQQHQSDAREQGMQGQGQMMEQRPLQQPQVQQQLTQQQVQQQQQKAQQQAQQQPPTKQQQQVQQQSPTQQAQQETQQPPTQQQAQQQAQQKMKVQQVQQAEQVQQQQRQQGRQEAEQQAPQHLLKQEPGQPVEQVPEVTEQQAPQHLLKQVPEVPEVPEQPGQQMVAGGAPAGSMAGQPSPAGRVRVVWRDMPDPDTISLICTARVVVDALVMHGNPLELGTIQVFAGQQDAPALLALSWPAELHIVKTIPSETAKKLIQTKPGCRHSRIKLTPASPEAAAFPRRLLDSAGVGVVTLPCGLGLLVPARHQQKQQVRLQLVVMPNIKAVMPNIKAS